MCIRDSLCTEEQFCSKCHTGSHALRKGEEDNSCLLYTSGSIPGAMVGGILLGIIEIFGKAYISSQVADAIVFAVLIVVLLVKPTGLFGKNIQEKV